MQKGKKNFGLLLTGITAVSIMFCSLAIAADKVVVIPLFSSQGGVNNIPTVISAGQVWMDRNLGAQRVAGSSSDSLAYGWLYQWGRLADGHESRTSPPGASLSNGDVPGHGNFITVLSPSDDWGRSLERGGDRPIPCGRSGPGDGRFDRKCTRARAGSSPSQMSALPLFPDNCRHRRIEPVPGESTTPARVVSAGWPL